MRFALKHPALARRSCDDCKRWLYDDARGGELLRDRSGRPLARNPRVAPVPCVSGACPKGTPETAWKVELNLRSLRLLVAYRECKAVGPTDEQRNNQRFRQFMALIDAQVASHEKRVAMEAAILNTKGL